MQNTIDKTDRIMCRLQIYLLLLPLAFTLAASLQIETYTLDGIPENWFDVRHPEPFKKLGNKYYYFEVGKKGNWWEAWHHCLRLNANLLTLESDEEVRILRAYIRLKRYDTSNFYWMSGHANANLDTYVSITTGEPLQYTIWSPGNPDNYHNLERCSHFWIQRDEISMNDLDCVEKCNYICETNKPKTISFNFW